MVNQIVRQRSKSGCGSNSGGNNGGESLKTSNYSDEDFLTLTVEGGEVPLSDSNDRNNISSTPRNNSRNSIKSNATNSSGNLTTGAILIEEPIIHKSTNMARFYYKRGNSSDKLINSNDNQ